MVKRSESVSLGGLWMKCHGLTMGPEVKGRFYPMRRAAPSLQMQPDELLVARYDATKTAI